jgi:hypothetical protein
LFNRREALWRDAPANGPPVPPVPVSFKSKRLTRQQVQANNKKQAKSNFAAKNEDLIFNEEGEESRTAFVSNPTDSCCFPELKGFEETLMSLNTGGCSQTIQESTKATLLDYSEMTSQAMGFPVPNELSVLPQSFKNMEQSFIVNDLKKTQAEEAFSKSLEKFVNSSEKDSFVGSSGHYCYIQVKEGRNLIVFDSSFADVSKQDQQTGEPSKPSKTYDSLKHPKSLDELRDFIFWGRYVRYTDLIESVDNLFKKWVAAYGASPIARIYLSYLSSRYFKYLKNERHVAKFYEENCKDLSAIVDNWKELKVPCSEYPRVPRCGRQFIEIQEYAPAVEIS